MDQATVVRFDRGVGTLRVDGELKGHLACVVGRLLGGSPWPWFVVVWLDGTKEHAFEDYGPYWWTVAELDAGYRDHHGPSARTPRRFLWFRYEQITSGDPCRFDFAWLPKSEAAVAWRELGLAISDF